MGKEHLEKINPSFVSHYESIDPTDEFFEFMDRPLKKSIRINTLKVNLNSFAPFLASKYKVERIPFIPIGLYMYHDSPGNTVEHQLGYYFVQETASMIPPQILAPEPGELVLDMCAAPGGKTTQIAQYMDNTGCVIANDARKSRANILCSNLQRMGVINTVVTVKDGRFFKRFKDTFDKVLLDAPCSNAGLVRKNYKYLRDWSLKYVRKLSNLQKELIMAAYEALKPGGILVYSTCTLEPDENEGVVDHLLQNTMAEIEPIRINVRSHTPFTEFEGKIYTSEVEKCLRLHPQDNDTEGFFIARIRKE
jgi:NOL1/NOP2/sun family putative RNA methylase